MFDCLYLLKEPIKIYLGIESKRINRKIYHLYNRLYLLRESLLIDLPLINLIHVTLP